MTQWPVWTPAHAVVRSLERVNEHNFVVYFSEMWQLRIVLTVRHVLFWSRGGRLSSFQACLKTRQRARVLLIRSQGLEDGCPSEGSCYLEYRLCFIAVPYLVFLESLAFSASIFSLVEWDINTSYGPQFSCCVCYCLRGFLEFSVPLKQFCVLVFWGIFQVSEFRVLSS